jgi:hypothetical protein
MKISIAGLLVITSDAVGHILGKFIETQKTHGCLAARD